MPERQSCEVNVGVVAVIARDSEACSVLVTRRPTGVHLPNAWELPGGKCEVHEHPRDAARRELLEETGIDLPLTVFQQFIHTRHAYDERVVSIHAFYAVLGARPVVAHRGVVSHRWVDAASLSDIAFPPANAPVTASLAALLVRHAGAGPKG